ncbi:replication protein A 70 kDa DNA-binding subunit B-like [Asparagus officinalis]|nr:replication protein A 70 kDa DNA-binding subunit B-like [Asparagus officinalis]
MCRNKRIKRTMDSSPNAEDQSMKRSARWLERASNYQVECNGKMTAERQRKGEYSFIKDLKLYQESFSIKVLILKVSLEQFSSSKGSGQVQKIIVIDEEGTKIQATLFNATIATFEEYIHLNNTIIIKNGKVRPINRKYASVNPIFGLAFGQNTKITVSENEINIGTLLFSFKRFEEVTKTNNENIFFDVLGFITSVRPLYF